MATTQISKVGEHRLDSAPKKCPQCNSPGLLVINGTFVKWLTCPKCKYKKLVENKEKPQIKVEPLMKEPTPTV